MPRDHTQVFDQIYKSERWGKGKGSGTGSSPKYCAGWLEYISRVIPENSIVLDIGCGDHQLYAGFDLTRWHYVGVDASETAVALARGRSPTARLHHLAVQDPNLVLSLCAADFILLKDVMMHWETQEIHDFLTGLGDNAPVIITANNHRYVRDPSKNGQPRVLDRYSWAPIPNALLEEYGFKNVGYYPAGKFKSIMVRRVE